MLKHCAGGGDGHRPDHRSGRAPPMRRPRPSKTEKKTEKKAAKKLTPQQQKMKDCAGEVAGREDRQEGERPRRLQQVHEQLPEGLTPR